MNDKDQKGLVVEEFTPRDIGEQKFVIPLYQRLYAWGKEEVEQLLKDLWASHRDEDYYLGNVVLAREEGKSSDENAPLILIDGQQRLTTIWLMGFVMRRYCEDWGKFLQAGDDLRIQFAARDDDREYLRAILENRKDYQAEGKDFNRNISSAIGYIRDFVKQEEVAARHEEFSKYVYEHTKMVSVVLPMGTDLNKYFEVMNNRGEQLEKHEILKARLLDKLDKEEHQLYGRIWNACSQMNQYIEKGLDSTIKAAIADYNGTLESLEKVIEAIRGIHGKTGSESTDPNSEDKTKYLLSNIIKDPPTDADKKDGDNKRDPETRFRSPLRFEVFLLHVLVLDRKMRISDLPQKDLIEEFKKVESELDAKRFLYKLLHYRILLDAYILKSVTRPSGTSWEIRKIVYRESSKEYRREPYLPASTRIQSMLNVSTVTEHWLTPALAWLDRNVKPTGKIEDSQFLGWLELLDNRLAYAHHNKKNPSEVGFDYILHERMVPVSFSVRREMLHNGTGTMRYWFFKLDYCLWKEWKKWDQSDKSDKTDNIWKDLDKKDMDMVKNFQFRSSRSVEHYFPQNPGNEQEKEQWEDELHRFGNLALISSSSNSSFGNDSPQAKKKRFELRIEQKHTLESLKLLLMHQQSDNWNPVASRKHGEAMIEVLNDYHNKFSHG